MENVSFVMAFTAGFLTFMSPCLLPLIPAYLSYLTGISFGEISGELAEERKRQVKRATIIHSLSFILGFTLVFVALGVGFTFLGQHLVEYQTLMQKIGGILIIFLALVIAGVVKLPFLQKEKKFSYKKEKVTVIGSILVGATFAAAWTPCVGPILGSILVYASSTASIKMGVQLLIAFSLGLAVPFFLSAVLINSFLAYMKKIEKYLRWVKIIVSIVLVVFGILLLTGNFR